VVTLNISPAPSQSLAVRMGVWMYKKPLLWKKSWVAKANALRMRVIALIVLVRGLEKQNSLVVKQKSSQNMVTSNT
jgi:hypothetical protein